MADAGDLKSPDESRVGSSPTAGTPLMLGAGKVKKEDIMSERRSSVHVSNNRKALIATLSNTADETRMTRNTMRTCPAYFSKKNNGMKIVTERNHIGIFLSLFCSDLYKLRSNPTTDSGPLYLYKNLDNPRFENIRSMQDAVVTFEDISDWFVENMFVSDTITARSAAKSFYLKCLENCPREINETIDNKLATDLFYNDIVECLQSGFAPSLVFWP